MGEGATHSPPTRLWVVDGAMRFRNGCFLFAAFAAGLAQNPDDPGLPPGATLSRSYAAL